MSLGDVHLEGDLCLCFIAFFVDYRSLLAVEYLVCSFSFLILFESFSCLVFWFEGCRSCHSFCAYRCLPGFMNPYMMIEYLAIVCFVLISIGQFLPHLFAHVSNGSSLKDKYIFASTTRTIVFFFGLLESESPFIF